MSENDITRELVRQIEEMKNTIKRLEVDKAQFEAINIDSNPRILGASVNDYDIGNYDWILVNTTAPRNMSGLARGILGRRIIITNYGSTLTLLHQSALSVATNRISTITGANVPIASGYSAMLLYMDDTPFSAGYRWRILFPNN